MNHRLPDGLHLELIHHQVEFHQIRQQLRPHQGLINRLVCTQAMHLVPDGDDMSLEQFSRPLSLKQTHPNRGYKIVSIDLGELHAAHETIQFPSEPFHDRPKCRVYRDIVPRVFKPAGVCLFPLSQQMLAKCFQFIHGHFLQSRQALLV